MKRKITLILCYDVDNQNITSSLSVKGKKMCLNVFYFGMT